MIPDNYDEYARIVANDPILTQEDIKERAEDAEYGDDEDVVVFYSSGEDPKRIPFSPRDQERAAEAMGDMFRTAGLTEDDVVLNLGAPADSHHQSGWGLKHGSEAIGATVINTSVDDFDTPAVREQWDDVTAVISLPRMLHSIGNGIQESTGEDLQDLFPNMRIALAGGDFFPQSLRDRIQAQWGVDTTRELYAATEMGAVAAEDEADDGTMVQTNDHLYIELLDPDADVDDTGHAPDDAITDIYDTDEPVTGAALFSAPDRELLPYTRYRAGDVLTAYPGDDGPRIRFEGREDRVINLSGAMVYPQEIEDAVQEYNASADWRAVVSVEDDYPVLDVYISGDADEAFVPYLAAENETIDTWYDSGAIKIRHHGYESEDELAAALADYDLDVDLTADRKVRRVGFDASYREEAG